MTRYGMVVNVARCIGCYNCFITCKDEHCGNDHLPYAAAQPMTGHTWMRVVETERGRFPKLKVDYTAIPCMHCDDPPCVAAARDGAAYLRDDGIVLIDPAKAAGQHELVRSCPYRVIYWNEEAQVPQKCTLCAHLLDAGWKEPRCVEACPTGALVFGDLDDPASEVSRLLASGTDRGAASRIRVERKGPLPRPAEELRGRGRGLRRHRRMRRGGERSPWRGPTGRRRRRPTPTATSSSRACRRTPPSR